MAALSLDDLRRRRSIKWRRYEPDVLPLWVAEMDTPLAPPIQRVLVEAVERGDTGYPAPIELPGAFAAFVAKRFGWAVDEGAVIPVADVMRGIGVALRAITEPGAGVVINPPVYPPFFSVIPDAGRQVVTSPLVLAEGRWTVDLADLERVFSRPEVGAYLLCNPHNPTGTVFTRGELLAVADLAERYRVRIVADEIHAPLVYPGATHVPLLSLADDSPGAAVAYATLSASKAWNLAGLKAAVLVAGPGVDGRDQIPEGVRHGGGHFGMLASQVAFSDGVPWLDALLAGLDANRYAVADLLSEHLPQVAYTPPEGTYLAWLDCRALGLSGEPARVFHDRGRVALNPGPAFGPQGTGFVRLNMATHPDLLAEGVLRMRRAVGAA